MLADEQLIKIVTGFIIGVLILIGSLLTIIWLIPVVTKPFKGKKFSINELAVIIENGKNEGELLKNYFEFRKDFWITFIQVLSGIQVGLIISLYRLNTESSEVLNTYSAYFIGTLFCLLAYGFYHLRRISNKFVDLIQEFYDFKSKLDE